MPSTIKSGLETNICHPILDNIRPSENNVPLIGQTIETKVPLISPIVLENIKRSTLENNVPLSSPILREY